MTYLAKRKRSASQSSPAKEERKGGSSSAPKSSPAAGTMPSPSEADAALAKYDAATDGVAIADDGPWRSVVLRTLSHGTDYDARSRRGSTETQEGGGKKGDVTLDARAEAAARLLAAALRRHDRKHSGEAADEGEGKGADCVASSPREVLVDAMWLADCMLEPPPPEPPQKGGDEADDGKSEAKAKAEEDRKASFGALSKMVSLLAFGSAETEGDDEITIPPSIPVRTLRTSLEPPLLAASGLIATGGAALMSKRLTKMNTDMHYRQTKFNLLREESEGYAKLITLLSGLPGGVVSTTDEAATGKSTTTGSVANPMQTPQKGGNRATSPQSPTTENGGDGEGGGAVQRVREIIGAFDLDPNRALDLTLDALEGELRSALRRADDRAKLAAGASGGVAGAAAKPDVSFAAVFRRAPGQAGAVRALLQIVRALDGGGESVPHLLGIKFASYSSRDLPAPAAPATAKAKRANVPPGKAHKNEGQTPRSLYAATALLSLHGILDVAALVPHLAPPASGLTEAYKVYQADYGKKIKKIGTVSLNASALSASEEKKSDDVAAAAAEAAKGEGDEPATPQSPLDDNQILGVFDALVEAGSTWDSATAVFGGTSVHRAHMAAAACALRAETGRNVCGWIANAITPAYEAKVDRVGSELLRQPISAPTTAGRGRGGLETPGRGGGTPAKSPGPPATPLRSASMMSIGGTVAVLSSSFSLLPPGASGGASTLEPNCILPDVVELLANPLAAIAEAGSVRADPVLYCRLCRLIGALLRSQVSGGGGGDEGVDIHKGTYDLLRTFLVPSLSMFPCNPSLASELWSVLSLLPYGVRYGLYGAWRGDGLEKAALRARTMGGGKGRKKPLPNIESEVQTGVSARYTLKRLSKDNIRDMGRQLAKASHQNPLVVFTAILNQIESYDNLILMMVETFRYVTLLSLDVIGYCSLDSLGGGNAGAGRSKLKADGVNAAQWLSSLETFTGAFFKKFPDVEVRGILSYILKRLRDGHVLELGVLRTLLKTAGGYGFADCESTASLSEVQLQGRCGSLLLRRETSDFGIVEKTSRRATVRLRSVLQSGDAGVAALVLLAQIRPRLLYGGPSKAGKKEHIKLLGNLYDNCQTVMSVLLDFITDGADDQFEQGAKSAATSGAVVGAVAKYARSLPTLGELHRTYGIDPATAWMLCRPLIRAAMSADNEAKRGKAKEQADADEKKHDASSNGVGAANALPPHLALHAAGSEESRAASKTMVPPIAWRSISVELFEAFYSHSLYDIHCPESRYTTEIGRLKKEADRLSQLKKGGSAAAATMSALAAAAAAAGGTDREIRQATTFTREHQAELDRVSRTADALGADLKRQRAHCDAVHGSLKGQANAFLSSLPSITEGDDAIDLTRSTPEIFLTYCVYPRCLLSPEDASYCAYFVMVLHRTGTPGFSTLTYFDKLVSAIVGSLYSITEDEAGNLSLLLEATWKVASSWRYDEEQFKKDVEGKPGSMMNDATGKAANVSFSDYKELYNRWHAILGDALMGGLGSSEYMHNRASLILLTRIVRFYPTRGAVGERLLNALLRLQEDNARQDIKAAAQGYGSQLIKARDDGVWREEDAAAAKARVEREKKAVKERKKKLEKQNEEMKEESDRITRELGGGRSRGRDDRRGHVPRGADTSAPRGGYADRRGATGAAVSRSPVNSSAATFTPAGGGHPRELGRGGAADAREPPPRRVDYRGADPPSARGTARDRDHHEPPRSMKWERGGGGDDRERGDGTSQHPAPSSDARASDRGRGGYATDDRRPPHSGAAGGRNAPPPSGGTERGVGGGGSGLEGRWVNEREGGTKRMRSPEAERDVGRGSEQQSKRLRTDQAPPRDRAGPGPPPHSGDSRRGDGYGRTSPHSGRGGPPAGERDTVRRSGRPGRPRR